MPLLTADLETTLALAPADAVTALIAAATPFYNEDEAKQYDPINHAVMNAGTRPDKTINYENEDENGKKTAGSKTQPVNRITIPLQRLIVQRAAAFLAGGGITLSVVGAAKESPLLDAMQEIWNRNKLRFKTLKIAETIKVKKEIAEVWYYDMEAKEMRSKLYEPSAGVHLLPVWSPGGNLLAFCIQTAVGEEFLFECWTDTQKITYQTVGGEWQQMEGSPVTLTYGGKMPVIYFYQDETEWNIVQKVIDRIETLLSNFADSIDYHASPILYSSGEINGFADKGEANKVVQGENGATLQYVTWADASASIKLELDTLFDIAYTGTQTPDISFKAMVGLGDISGTALDRVMIDAQLKAVSQQEGDFGETIQRRCNFLKSACIALKIGGVTASEALTFIEPVFVPFSLTSEEDLITLAQKANGGLPVVSQRKSIEMARVTDDAPAMLVEIKAEAGVTLPAGDNTQPTPLNETPNDVGN